MEREVTFGQLKTTFERYRDLIPKIDQKDFRVLWIDDYHDGMLAGMLQYNNQKFRFEIIHDYAENVRRRIFALIELTDEQIAEESYWNNMFKKYVGNHNNLDDNNELKQHPLTTHRLFYDEFKQRAAPNYDMNVVTGWFFQ